MALPFNLISQTASNLRLSLLIVFSVSGFIVLLGSGLNHLNHKYLRALPHESCAHQILNTNVQNSFLCCDTHFRHLDWVCIASYDKTNKILASTHALFIPFSLTLATTAVELLAHLFTHGLSSRGVSLGKLWVLVKSSIFRLLLVLSLVFLRTVVLYMGLGRVERAMQAWYYGESVLNGSDNCWYAAHTKDQLCRDAFDFSDHIVLFLVHYIAPVAVELAAIRSKMQARLLQRQQSSTIGEGYMISGAVLYLAPVVLSLSLCALSLRGVWFTALYFHTQMENILALIVSIVFVALPLSALAGSWVWSAAVHGTLHRDVK